MRLRILSKAESRDLRAVLPLGLSVRDHAPSDLSPHHPPVLQAPGAPTWLGSQHPQARQRRGQPRREAPARCRAAAAVHATCSREDGTLATGPGCRASAQAGEQGSHCRSLSRGAAQAGPRFSGSPLWARWREGARLTVRTCCSSRSPVGQLPSPPAFEVLPDLARGSRFGPPVSVPSVPAPNLSRSSASTGLCSHSALLAVPCLGLPVDVHAVCLREPQQPRARPPQVSDLS